MKMTTKHNHFLTTELATFLKDSNKNTLVTLYANDLILLEL